MLVQAALPRVIFMDCNEIIPQKGITMNPDILATEDSPNMFMDDRLNLQALKNKHILDESLDLSKYQQLTKKELLAMLLKSTVLLHEGAEHIAQQRSSLVRYQMKELQAIL